MMGWQCPGCGGCYSPSMSVCPRCCAHVVSGAGADPLVVPSVFSPCPHLRCNEETGGQRCVDCGYLVPTVVWRIATPGAATSTGTVTHCQHGRAVSSGCHECQATMTGGAS